MTNANMNTLLADLVRLTARQVIAEDGDLQGWEPVAAHRVTLIHKRVMREVYRTVHAPQSAAAHRAYEEVK